MNKLVRVYINNEYVWMTEEQWMKDFGVVYDADMDDDHSKEN